MSGKRCLVLLMMILLAIVAVGCSKPQEVVSKVDEKDLLSFEGVYHYDYENDTEDLVEDHYIVLESTDEAISGYYYGTSDDFDPAREGYYPGFYVSRMQDLTIDGNAISFSIRLFPSDLFSKPIGLEYKNSKDVPGDINPNWDNAQIIDEDAGLVRSYEGKIENGEIVISNEIENRVFKKR